MFHFRDSSFPPAVTKTSDAELIVKRNHRGASSLRVYKIRWHGGCISPAPMKPRANTYYLITASASEDKRRSAAEVVIYAVFVLSAVVSIITAASQPVFAPTRITDHNCKTVFCA